MEREEHTVRNTSEIKNVTVLGGDLIGSRWAVYFLWKGFSVHVYDINKWRIYEQAI
jgi:3-hydroxyacyl-CoA dehydrogenase